MAKLYLTSVHWNSDNKENIRFNNRTEQQNYFNIPAVFETVPRINFDIGDGYQTTATIYTETSILNAINTNYAIVEFDNNYYFYFVERIVHISSKKCYNLTLTLDIIQTYYIDLTFDKCLINRAHLPRFEKILNRAYYLYNKNSHLYKPENIDFEKQYISRKINLYPNPYMVDTGNKTSTDDEITDWLIDNVACWVYYFIKPFNKTAYYATKSGTTNILTQVDLSKSNETYFTKSLENNMLVLCAPIYKSDNHICVRVSNGSETHLNPLNVNTINKFIDLNDLSANIVTRKYSRRSPFLLHCNSQGDLNLKLSLETGSTGQKRLVLFSNNTTTELSRINILYPQVANAPRFLPCLNIDDLELKPQVCYHENTIAETPKYLSTFSTWIESVRIGNYETNYITVDYLKNNYIEPKETIFGKDLNITDGINNYSITLAEFNTINFTLDYYENLSPDICRYNIFLKPTSDNTDSIYHNKQGLYNGFSSSLDLSIPFNVEQLETFLANNKNFYLQSAIRNVTKGVSGMNNPKTAIAGVLVGVTNDLLTLDNLSHAPDTVINNGNDSSGLVDYNNLLLRLEYRQILPTNMQTFSYYLYRYGYSFYEYGNLKQYDNIRKYFNYIKADIDCVQLPNGNVSTVIYKELKKIFSNGITLWNHTDKDFDYTVNNYEREFD